jgi:hypothetical protein
VYRALRATVSSFLAPAGGGLALQPTTRNLRRLDTSPTLLERALAVVIANIIKQTTRRARIAELRARPA